MRDQDTDNATDKGAQDQNNQAQDTGNATDKGAHMIPKSRFDQVVQQRKDAEAALDEVCQELVSEIPEDMRDVIPDLPPAAKIKWIRTALKKGIFGGQPTQSGPDSKRPSGKKPTDFEGMSPQAIMAQGYKN
jgi:hypothetical protein